MCSQPVSEHVCLCVFANSPELCSRVSCWVIDERFCKAEMSSHKSFFPAFIKKKKRSETTEHEASDEERIFVEHDCEKQVVQHAAALKAFSLLAVWIFLSTDSY